MDRRQWLALGLASSVPALARAQSGGSPLQLIVPVPPGGSVDLTGRLLAEHLPRTLKQAVVVENRPGASGSIAAAGVARAAGDPNMLMLVFDSHVTNPLVYPQLPYTLRDFTPISRLLSFPLVCAVPADLPVGNIKEFIALAKSKPGALNVSSAGLGTLNHLAAELFKMKTHTHIVHIPYRGGGAAVADLISGQVQMMIDVMPNVYPLAKDGRIRGIAVSTAVRFPGAPELPTIAESGVPGFEASAWDGVLAPAGTPEPIVNKLNAAIRTALADPELVETLKSRGARPVAGTPQEFAQHIVESTRKWAVVVKASGARID